MPYGVSRHYRCSRRRKMFANRVACRRSPSSLSRAIFAETSGPSDRPIARRYITATVARGARLCGARSRRLKAGDARLLI